MSRDGGGPVQVSARAAEVPRWSHDGKRLFFKSAASMMAVDVRTSGQEIDFVNERKLFDGEIAREYDVAPNGDFFTMLPAPGIAYQRHIQIRTQWFEEVERMMRGANNSSSIQRLRASAGPASPPTTVAQQVGDIQMA